MCTAVLQQAMSYYSVTHFTYIVLQILIDNYVTLYRGGGSNHATTTT